MEYHYISLLATGIFFFVTWISFLYSFATKPSSGSTQPSSGAETLVIDGRFLSGNWETTFFRNLGRYNFSGDINVQSFWYVRELGGIEKSLLFCNSRRKVFVLRLKIIQEKLIQLHSQTVEFLLRILRTTIFSHLWQLSGLLVEGKKLILGKRKCDG